ncbi:3'(2'),5'-bisphosphate nucleotidase [Photobacterium aphoticum]|uniref:3'(2'),5-bisphosphonucleoside 3'(2')-phosphohydrolase n=1 Tax=Photobacterium aphoticum TaxID=754436 RepID=A0A090QZ14_9GAMM|nr:3'(2'),5'-bisphosphate nucleotidase [Photobacterium aphoticum]
MGSQLDALYEIAVSAGQAIMARYHGQVQIAEKADHSPVTEADLAANAIILEGLAALTPDIPVLSEESEHSTWEARQSWERFWLVDPLDGTKEFLRKKVNSPLTSL